MQQLRFILIGFGFILCSASFAFGQPQPLQEVNVLNPVEVFGEVDVNIIGSSSQCSATTHNGCSCTGDKSCSKDQKAKTATCTSKDGSTITCTDKGAACSCN